MNNADSKHPLWQALSSNPHFIMDLQKNLDVLYKKWSSGPDA